jgi:two-component sensor histidine kinase
MASHEASSPGRIPAGGGGEADHDVRLRHANRLFEGLAEGMLVAQLIRDADGRAVDWLILDVNAAFASLDPRGPSAMIGRTIRTIIPGFETTLIDETAEMVAQRTSTAFTCHVATLGRDFEGRAIHLEDDRFAVLLLDVTERIRELRQQEALLLLGDQLREQDKVVDMAATAARIMGETLGVVRAGFGHIDLLEGTIDIQADWTAHGVASLTGRHPYADYGDLLDHLARSEPLVVEDVRRDPRMAGKVEASLAIDVQALVNLPVGGEHGGAVAAVFVHDRRARRWTDSELIFLRKIADRVEAGVARAQAEARQRVLNLELSHRMKNTLTMVQAVATQTLRRASDRPAVEAFERRLGALATAHDVLLGRNWASADLATVARDVLAVLAAPGRCRIEGPPVALGPRAALSTSLLVHELGTNAVKYGALSVEHGGLIVRWRIDPTGAGDQLVLEWREEGGPPAAPPTRIGFGSRLIERGLIGGGGVESHYLPTGFTTTMCALLTDLRL